MAAENAALIRYLDKERAHALGILAELDDETLGTAKLASGWTALGMIQHLAIDVERFWFGAVILGDEAVIKGLANGTAWQVAPGTPAVTILDLYRRECERANRVLAAVDTDAAPAWWPDFMGEFRLNTNREVVLHVLTETSGHAGHLDAWRELVDGRQYFVLGQ